MARPTNTRAQLRRELAVRMSMPYAVRIPNGYADVSAGGLVTTVIDTVNLKQADDFWNGQWAYVYDGTNEWIRKITDYDLFSSKLTLESALPSASSTTMDYEIHSKFTAVELHNAINKAIDDAYPSFFDTVENTETVLVENKLAYDISALGFASVHGVWLERPAHTIQAVVVSATYSAGPNTTAIVLEELNLTDVDSRWMISCYYGDAGSEGDSNAILTAVDATNTVTVSGRYDTYKDNDKVLLWDTRDQYLTWYPLKAIKFTPKQWPTTMYVGNNLSPYAGVRLKLIGSKVPARLLADAETTVVPKEFVMLSAMATLYASRMNDNRVDRQMYATLAAEYAAQADKYKQRNIFRGMDTEIWMEGADDPFYGSDNPMDWS